MTVTPPACFSGVYPGEWNATNEFEYDVARVEGKRLFDRPVKLADGEV